MPRRLLTIVLDGHEPSVAEAMMAAGELPAFARLKERSRCWPLDHGRAKRTGLAGEHLATGLDPEAAQRWSAVFFDPRSYAIQQRPTGLAPFTAELSLQTLVFDAPYFDVTRGGRTAGLVAWGAHDPGIPPRSQPESLGVEVEQRFGPYDGKGWVYGFAWPSEARCRTMGERLVAAVEQRAAVAEWLLTERLPDWQLALVAVSELHSGNEALWHGIDSGHPLADNPSAAAAGQGLRNVLRAVDRLVGRLSAAVPDADLALLAPHGMGRNAADVPSMLLLPEALHRLFRGRPGWTPRPDWQEAPVPLLGEEESWEVAMNGRVRPHRPLLARLRHRRAESGGMRLGWMPAAQYRPAWPYMEAFALPAFYDGQIRINLRGREARGLVAPGDYERACDRLEAFLQACRDPRTGEPAVAAVERAGGDPLQRHGSACDLTVIWRGSPLALAHPRIGTVGPAPFRRTGGHTGGDGHLWLAATGLAPGEAPRASTFDAVPTLLAHLGQPVPGWMSGRPLLEHRAAAAE